MTAIAFIGLGNMGGPMAANLVKAGHRGHGVRPRTRRRCRRWPRPAANAPASAAEAAAGAEVVITMLPAGEHVREVWTGQGGLIDVARQGGAEPLLIDCSTIDVDSARDGRRGGRGGGARHAGRAGLRRRRRRAGRHADLHGRRAGRGLRARQADAGGDGQEHRPCRRVGRRAGGEDLQQHDAGDQHGRACRRGSCWRPSSAWTMRQAAPDRVHRPRGRAGR